MKGLELSKKYYLEYGKKMLDEQFPTIKKYLAIGLVGPGSECLGYDDELSCDHDFEPGFCIFVPDDEKLIDRKTLFNLERAYSKLPKTFLNYKRNFIQPAGLNRHGIITIDDFYLDKIGQYIEDEMDFFKLQDSYLLMATNGEVFEDNYGLFTKIRNSLKHYPINVKKKKMVGCLIMMQQSGFYNYKRCILRNEIEASQFSIIEFVKYAIQMIFLLNDTYIPHYKWIFRALKNLTYLNDCGNDLNYLLTTNNEESIVNKKFAIIEKISNLIIEKLLTDGYIKSLKNLEECAIYINDTITNNKIRNLDLLYAI